MNVRLNPFRLTKCATLEATAGFFVDQSWGGVQSAILPQNLIEPAMESYFARNHSSESPHNPHTKTAENLYRLIKSQELSGYFLELFFKGCKEYTPRYLHPNLDFVYDQHFFLGQDDNGEEICTPSIVYYPEGTFTQRLKRAPSRI